MKDKQSCMGSARTPSRRQSGELGQGSSLRSEGGQASGGERSVIGVFLEGVEEGARDARSPRTGVLGK